MMHPNAFDLPKKTFHEVSDWIINMKMKSDSNKLFKLVGKIYAFSTNIFLLTLALYYKL